MPKLARTAVNTPAKKVVWPRFLSESFQLKVSRTPHQKRTMSCTTVVTLGWLSFFFRVLGRGLGEVMTLTFLLGFTLLPQGSALLLSYNAPATGRTLRRPACCEHALAILQTVTVGGNIGAASVIQLTPGVVHDVVSSAGSGGINFFPDYNNPVATTRRC